MRSPECPGRRVLCHARMAQWWHQVCLARKAGKGSDLAALLLHGKAFPCQCKGRKFLLERGGLEMEKLWKQRSLIDAVDPNPQGWLRGGATEGLFCSRVKNPIFIPHKSSKCTCDRRRANTRIEGSVCHSSASLFQ